MKANRVEAARMRRRVEAAENRVLLLERASDRSVSYRQVDETTVPHLNRTAAAAAVTLSTMHFGLTPPPTLRWFLPGSGETAFRAGRGLLGRADRRTWTVWVHAGLDVAETVAAAAHEAKHLTQPDTAALRVWQADEMAARMFEAEFADQFAKVFEVFV